MARVTVEDCIDKVDSPYELVLVAKERATQLNSGIEPTVDKDNDKNTVISLREIAAEKVKVPVNLLSLFKSAVDSAPANISLVQTYVGIYENLGDSQSVNIGGVYVKENFSVKFFFNPGESAGSMKGKNALGIINLNNLKIRRIFF